LQVESSGAVAWEVVPGVELVAEMAVVASPAAGAKAAEARAGARVGVARAVAE
jgi:hypothetical protein